MLGCEEEDTGRLVGVGVATGVVAGVWCCCPGGRGGPAPVGVVAPVGAPGVAFGAEGTRFMGLGLMRAKIGFPFC